MADTFRVEIVAADRLVWEGDALALIARTTEGDMGIMAHHEPVIAPLVPHAAEVTTADGKREIIAVDGGFLSVTMTRAAIISPSARLAHEVSASEAEAELREAQRKLDDGDVSEETQRHFNRATAQLKAAERAG